MQHYVIKFVGDLRQVGDFLRVLRFPSPIKLNRHDIIIESGIKHNNPNNVLKVALSTNTLATTKTINHNFTIQHTLHQHCNL